MKSSFQEPDSFRFCLAILPTHFLSGKLLFKPKSGHDLRIETDKCIPNRTFSPEGLAKPENLVDIAKIVQLPNNG